MVATIKHRKPPWVAKRFQSTGVPPIKKLANTINGDLLLDSAFPCYVNDILDQCLLGFIVTGSVL